MWFGGPDNTAPFAVLCSVCVFSGQSTVAHSVLYLSVLLQCDTNELIIRINISETYISLPKQWFAGEIVVRGVYRS